MLPYKAQVCCEDEQRQNSRKLLIKIFHSLTGFWDGMFNVQEQNFLFFSHFKLYEVVTHMKAAKLITFSFCDYKCHTSVWKRIFKGFINM